MYEGHRDMDNRVGTDCGKWGGVDSGEQQGEKWDNHNRTTIKYSTKSSLHFESINYLRVDNILIYHVTNIY